MLRRALTLLCLAAPLVAQTPPRRQIVEDLRLDATTEDFPVIHRVRVGPRGQIAVFIRQGQTVRMYDSTGRKVASFGRTGSGPGESRAVNDMGWKGDTLWLYDNGLKRFTFISPAGTLIRHEVLPPSLNLGTQADAGGNPAGGLYLFTPKAMLSDGRVLAWGDVGTGRDDHGNVTTESVLFTANADGSQRRIVGRPLKPVNAGVSLIDDQGKRRTAGVPFVVYPVMVYATDGTRFGVVSQKLDRSPGEYTVRVIRSTGDTAFSRTFGFRGTPIPAAVRDSAIAVRGLERYYGRGSADAGYTAAVRARLRDMVKPITPRIYPAVEDLVLGQGNTTWVTMTPVGNTREVVSMNGRGEPAFRIVLPRNSSIVQASPHAVWVVETDEDDLPSVVRYRIK